MPRQRVDEEQDVVVGQLLPTSAGLRSDSPAHEFGVAFFLSKRCIVVHLRPQRGCLCLGSAARQGGFRRNSASLWHFYKFLIHDYHR